MGIYSISVGFMKSVLATGNPVQIFLIEKMHLYSGFHKESGSDDHILIYDECHHNYGHRIFYIEEDLRGDTLCNERSEFKAVKR